jgi:hypothetical protein
MLIILTITTIREIISSLFSSSSRIKIIKTKSTLSNPTPNLLSMLATTLMTFKVQ